MVLLYSMTISGRGPVDALDAALIELLDAIVSTEGVVRSATLISLAAQVPYRVLPLVLAASGSRPANLTAC
jgi:hypothetical protein